MQRTIALFAAAVCASQLAFAQAQPAAKNAYQPEVGQEGKDVIWVPTPDDLVDKMLSMAKVTPKDFVIDLGSGDGRIAIAAAKKFGATARGIEYNPDMVDHANARAKEAGVAGKVQFVKADIFTTDFSAATVITMYLLPELNLRLRPKLLDMKPGTRLVSHAFTMGDWDPDERAQIDGRSAMLWIVPAKVEGRWALRQSAGNGSSTYDVELKQTFQTVSGTVRQGSFSADIEKGRLNGEEITFSFNDASGTPQRFVGKVAGARMSGALDGGKVAQVRWSAERKN